MSVYRKQLEVCFFSTLEQLDPSYAAELSARDRKYKLGVTARLQDKLVGAVTAAEDDIRTVSQGSGGGGAMASTSDE